MNDDFDRTFKSGPSTMKGLFRDQLVPSTAQMNVNFHKIVGKEKKKEKRDILSLYFAFVLNH